LLDGNGLIEKVIPPIDVPDGENYKLNQVLNETDLKFPAFPQSLTFRDQVKLPRSSLASFIPANDPESYALRLERDGYYKLDLTVQAHARNRKGQTPANISLQWVDKSQVTTYEYRIGLDIVAQRTNDPMFIPGDYVEWAENLFNNIKAHLYEYE
jgi:hypothetical protein